jgi:enterobacteria phage integrase
MLLYTGQRVSDAHDMTVPDSRNKIKVASQQKTGVKLTLTTHPNLIRSLKALPSGNVAALVTSFGKPYTVKGFANMIAEAIRDAGLPERCVPHGLRKAAARRLAEAGCTPHEIMAVTGHKTLAEVERYTRAAGQEKLNETALARQLKAARTKRRHESGKPTVPKWQPN